MSRVAAMQRYGRGVQFGEFRLDYIERQLRRGNTELPLRDKSLAVLCHLVENAGRLVSREQLLRVVWPGLSVSPGVVRISVHEVRAALGDDPAAPRFIETVGRRGYRFTAAPRAAPMARAEFVGRDGELARLHAWLERCSQHRRQTVFISGEAGLGKTALVERFAAAVRGAGLAQVAQGKCVDLHGSTEPYLPVLGLLGDLCRERPDVARVLERWAPSWLSQLSGVIGGSAADTVRGRVPTPTRNSMLREFADAMEVLARRSPVVLVLEDLHWSDTSTLDLLTYLAERSTPACLLVVGTYRPVEVVLRGGRLRRSIRQLIARGRAVGHPLELLTPRDVRTYLDRLLADTAVDPQLAEAMYAKSDGNPLLLVEIVEHLLERGILALTDGHWRLGAGHESLPQSLRELVAHEFEALADEDKRILAAASVVGNDFEAISVAAATGLAQPSVEHRCARLAAQQQLICTTGMASWPDGALGGSYRFRHAVHRDAIYRRLAPTQRARLHRAVGDRIEAGWATGAPTMAGVLAAHFEQGADWPRAVHHHAAAVGAAKARLAAPEVVVHAEAVLGMLERLPPSARRDEIEMRCALDLAAALLAVRGYGTPEIAPLIARARDLAVALELPLNEIAVWGDLFNPLTGVTQPTAVARQQQSPAFERRAVADLIDS